VGEYSWQFAVGDRESYMKDQKIFGFDKHYYKFSLSQAKVGIGRGAAFRLVVHRLDGDKEVGLKAPKRHGMDRQGIKIGEE
jgi:hypothetical protein